MSNIDFTVEWVCTECRCSSTGYSCTVCEHHHPSITAEECKKLKQEAQNKSLKMFLGSPSKAKPSKSVFETAPSTTPITFGFTPSTSTSPPSFGFTPSAPSAPTFGFTPSAPSTVTASAPSVPTFGFTPSPPTVGFTPSTAPTAPNSSSSSFVLPSTTSATSSLPLKSIPAPSPLPHQTPTGQLYIHGSGECDQLGLGTVRERRKPTLLKALPSNDPVVLYSVNSLHTAVLTKQGALYTFGCNDDGALGRTGEEEIPLPIDSKHFLSPLLSVSCGDCHTSALDNQGRVYLWGSYKDSSGHLGFPASASPNLTEDGLRQMTPSLLSSLPPISSLSSGAQHTVALTSSGHLYTWGSSEHGQLCSPPTEEFEGKRRLSPPHLIDLSSILEKGEEPKEVIASGHCTFLLTNKGTLYGSGLNNYHQLGLGTNQEVCRLRKIDVNGEKVLSVSCGGFHSAALTESGRVFTWGRADLCGRNIASGEKDITRPLLLSSLDNVATVSCGNYHTLATTKSGDVFTWGQGLLFQLGNATPEQNTGNDENVPYLMVSKQLESRYVMSARGGASHSVEFAWDGGYADVVTMKPVSRKRGRGEREAKTEKEREREEKEREEREKTEEREEQREREGKRRRRAVPVFDVVKMEEKTTGKKAPKVLKESAQLKQGKKGEITVEVEFTIEL